MPPPRMEYGFWHVMLPNSLDAARAQREELSTRSATLVLVSLESPQASASQHHNTAPFSRRLATYISFAGGGAAMALAPCRQLRRARSRTAATAAAAAPRAAGGGPRPAAAARSRGAGGAGAVA